MSQSMPKELKAKWVAALRSGEYKQGIGAMRSADDGYCCLGVLEMVAEGKVETDTFGNSLCYPTAEFARRHNVVGGIDSIASKVNFILTINGRRSTASEHNDSPYRPATFLEIADAIERDIKGV